MVESEYLPPFIVDRAQQLELAIGDLFSVEDVTTDVPERGYVRFRGHFLIDLATHFDVLRARFETHGFTPLVRHDAQGGVNLIAMPHVFEKKPTRPWINLLLFVLTILSTLFVGSAQATNLPVDAPLWRVLLAGWPFSLSILLILGAHELGHYFAARYHNVDVTLPFFIPIPTIIGTMGAFIQIREPVKNRRALLDIGAAGPLFGLVFAIPILIIGLATSPVGPLPSGPYLLEGNSLLYALLKTLVFGQFLPAGGIDVSLNQLAWAGWAGLLVTGLNLLPIGQLDGGHLMYVLFGERTRRLFWPVIIGLVVISFALQTDVWWLWIALLFFFGRGYAQPLDDVTPLDPRRRSIAILALVIFVVIFVPNPFQQFGDLADGMQALLAALAS